jgi:hypothetical protein
MGVPRTTDKRQGVPTIAALNAGKELGLTDTDIRVVIGYDPSVPQFAHPASR